MLSSLAPSPCSVDALCIVLDVRSWSDLDSGAELRRLWTESWKEVLRHGPQLPQLGFVSLHDGYYQSRLPLGHHTVPQIRAALVAFDKECSRGALLGGYGSTAGLLASEHCLKANLSGQLPRCGRSSAEKKAAQTKGRKAAPPVVERLFAIGEDVAVAAIRSALLLLESGKAHSKGSACARRIEYWSASSQLLPQLATLVSGHGAADIQVQALIAALRGAKASPEEAAQMEEELRQGVGHALNISVLPLSASGIGSKVKRFLDLSLPLTLRLPSLEDLPISAEPLVLLPMKLRQNLMDAISGAASRGPMTLEYEGRFLLQNVSVELFFGPSWALRPASITTPAQSQRFAGLLMELEKDEALLVVKAPLNALCLAPFPCMELFALMPLQTERAGLKGAAILRGLTNRDFFQPAGMHAAAPAEESSWVSSRTVDPIDDGGDLSPLH